MKKRLKFEFTIERKDGAAPEDSDMERILRCVMGGLRSIDDLQFDQGFVSLDEVMDGSTND